MHCIANAYSKYKIYTAWHAHNAYSHGALEDPTALSQQSQNALSNTLCKHHATAIILSILGEWTVCTTAICSFSKAVGTL